MKHDRHAPNFRRQEIVRNQNIATGRDVEVYVCLSCGQAFPADNRELLQASDGTSGNLFHATCSDPGARNRGHCKRVGMMPWRAAEALCGPRFKRRDSDPPAPVFAATVGDRIKTSAKPAPALAVVKAPTVEPPRTDLCESCGEALVDGACPFNTADWPHSKDG